MPPLNPENVHIDRPLSNLMSIAFADTEEYIADLVMPVFGVNKRSDIYYELDKGDWLRVNDDVRAPGARSKKVGWSVNSQGFVVRDYGLLEEHALETIENADDVIQVKENSFLHLTNQLMMLREIRVATIVMSAGNVGSGVTLSGTDQWTDPNLSDPIGDINSAIAYFEQNVGVPPNKVVTTPRVLRIARTHPDLLDMYKYGRSGALKNEELADVFQVEEILVGHGIKENALEGGTSSITNIWEDNILFAHIEPARGLRTKTLGLQLRWNRPETAGLPLVVQEQMKDMAGDHHTWITEARYAQDEVIIAPEFGYVIQDPI